MIGPYLTDTITLRLHKGTDKWGEPNTTQDTTVKGFIEYKERQVTNALGQLVVSMVKVTLRPMTIIRDGYATRAANTIGYMDKMVIDGEVRAIVSLGKGRDFSVRTTEVYLA
ncbi:MAG: hypothetical protein PHQ43_00910 [Dehalococcoidales bacterium]|nr:hypothetical protein [Dehalococcoidales bacterium]